ncbi:MAG: FtsX-like permease family protein, partial [Clostridiaceae bacterium]
KDADIIKKYINENFGDKGVYFVSTKEEQLSYRMTEEEIRGEISMAQSLPLVFLIVALLILSIIIKKLVENDRLSIGILKSMGYNNKTLIGYYTKLTIFIGLSGSMMGIIIGGIGSYQFTKVYTEFFQVPMLSYNFDGKYIVQAIVISVCFSVLSGLIGARGVIHLMPQESMKPKTIASGKHIFIEKTKWYSKLKFTNKMVIRNILRQKGRFFLVVFGVALSCSMLLLPFAFRGLMNSMFIEQYEKYQVYDYDVSFKTPLAKDEIDDFKNEYKDSYMEEYSYIPIEIIFNGDFRTTMIIGVKENSKVYNLINPKEQELKISKGDFYITEGLAKSFGIEKGDTITLKKYFGQENEIKVIVTDIVQQKLGSNGFMLASDIQDKFIDSKESKDITFNGVYIQGNINEDKILENENVANINSVKKLIDTFKQFTALIMMSLGVMIVFSGIFAFVVIYIVSIITINERKHEFSSLRVLGLKKSEIFSIISRENMIASIFGIILGIPLGKLLLLYLSSYFSNDLYSITIDLKPNMIIFATLSCFVFVILGQLITKSKINKLDFIEALKQRIS